jgi:hypothetical protein
MIEVKTRVFSSVESLHRAYVATRRHYGGGGVEMRYAHEGHLMRYWLVVEGNGPAENAALEADRDIKKTSRNGDSEWEDYFITTDYSMRVRSSLLSEAEVEAEVKKRRATAGEVVTKEPASTSDKAGTFWVITALLSILPGCAAGAIFGSAGGWINAVVGGLIGIFVALCITSFITLIFALLLDRVPLLSKKGSLMFVAVIILFSLSFISSWKAAARTGTYVSSWWRG